MDRLPTPRGELSSLLVERLPAGLAPLPEAGPVAVAEPLADDDLHLALYLCYELHYRGLRGVDERWEWDPSLLAFRAALEHAFETGLVAELGPPPDDGPPPHEMDVALGEVAEADEGPSLAVYLERHGTVEQVKEFVVHRSAYQLKEADPHSWAIPRLSGPPKAALVEVQADEYGGGRPERVHAELFAVAMEAIGLDRSYGAYVEAIPGVTLATVNLMSMFGLHRRWRGAIAGHLALFEMTSSVPNRRYSNALSRLGMPPASRVFFDEHVEADAVHENIAAVDLAGGLARQEPQLAGQIVWGASALALLDRRWTDRLLGCWEAGESSLRSPLPEAVPA